MATTMDHSLLRRPGDRDAGNWAAWLSRKARLAAALAVIKSRPPGVSGREHAEALASRLRSRDHSWRHRAQELQEEVLCLRQKLLLAKMVAQIRDAGHASGGDGILSQDLPLPTEKDASMMDQDSSCGTEPLLPTVDPVNPAAPVDPQTCTPVTPFMVFPPPQDSTPRGRSMQAHMHFLQSLCGLRRAGNRALGPAWSAWSGPQQEDQSVVADSLHQLLGCVVSAVRSPDALPSRDLVLEACRVLARATDAWCSHPQACARFVAAAEGSLEELAGLLLHGDALGKAQEWESLTEYLVLLGESSLLRPLLVRHLLSLVGALAERLCHLCQVEEHSEPEDDVPHHLENSFHVLWVLEKLLQQQKVEVGCEAFVELLGRSVLLLSDEFPLFALYMWRVGALLSW